MLTWCCSTDRWSCPNCTAIATRGRMGDAAWAARVRAVQRDHAKTCRGTR